MSDGTIDIGVRLDPTQAESEARKLGNSLGSTIDKGLQGSSKNLSQSAKQAVADIGAGLTAYGAAYSKAVTVPILAAGGASVAAAVKIDTALTGVRKTVDGTEEQYEQLKQAAIEFSKTNAVDPAQILDIQALGAQLGYSITELDKLGEVVSGLSISTDMDAETAAMELAAFSNIVNMSHDDVDRYGSTIVDLGNHFATTESEISHMAQRIAGAGAQIGMTEADILGMATALSSMGINAEAGGTAISTIMSNIDKAVASGGEKLETWAQTARMSADEFAEAWKSNPVDALNAVLVGMDAATEEGGNMSLMLDELGITSIRQTDIFKRLANNVEMLPNAVKTANNAWEENTALTKEVENRNNSLAAKFEILKHKIVAVAIDAGEPLADALMEVIEAGEPLIQMLADGAKAFSDMSDDEQRTVIQTLAVIAAFGPMTAGVGRLMTGVANASNKWDAFNASLKALNTNLKTSRAAAANATSGFGKYFSVVRDGQTEVYKVNRKTGEYVATNSKLARALSTTTAGVKVQNVALNAGTKAMNIARAAASTLGTAMKAIAPVAILTVGIELFTKISGAIKDATERSKNYEDATKGLSSAAAGTNIQINAETGAFKSLSSAIDSIDLDGFTEQHTNLANAITEASQSAATSQAQLTQYSTVIQELAGRSDLTGAEIAKLKIAVDEVNEACGTSYEVVQNNAGAYVIMADGAEVAKDAIYNVIEAQKAQIRAEVEAQNYKAAYEQYAKDQEALADATKLVAQRQEEYNRALEVMNQSGTDAYMEGTAQAAADAEIALNDAKDALANMEGQAGATQSAMNKLEEQQILTNMAISDEASAIIKAADANLAFKAGVQGMDVDLVAFTQALQDMGFTADQVASMSTEDAMRLAQGWKDGTDSLITAADEANISVPESLRSMGEDANEAIVESGKELTSSTTDIVESAQSELDRLDGVTPGTKAATAFAGAIRAGQGPSRSAGIANANAANSGMGSVDTNPTGQAIGTKFATGIGVKKSLSKLKGEANANAAATGFQSQNKNASTWGDHLGGNFASGISGTIEKAKAAASGIANAIKGILGHSVPKEGVLHEGGEGEKRWGRHLVQNIIEGVDQEIPELRRKMEDAAAVVEDAFGNGIVVEFDERGQAIAKGLIVGYEKEDPMKQITQSVTKGVAALNLAMQGGGSTYNYTTNNQTNQFNAPIQSAADVSRELRLQQLYGLAGSR